MVERINQRSAKQGTNKPPVTTILIVSLVLCAIVGLGLVFFAGASDPVGEEVGGAVEEIAPPDLPEERPAVDPSVPAATE